MFALAGKICLVILRIWSVVICDDTASLLFKIESGWVYKNKDILICSLSVTIGLHLKELNYFIINNCPVLEISF